MRLFHRQLYFWVLVGILVGGSIGFFHPKLGVQLKFLADAFVMIVKVIILPVIFCTVVLGIANAGSAQRVGRVSFKALFYFEVVSTFALLIGFGVAHLFKPGSGFNVDPKTLDPHAVEAYAPALQHASLLQRMWNSSPMIQVLGLAILIGFLLLFFKGKNHPLARRLEQISHFLFIGVKWVMRLAPLGAGGAMAFTIGKYGMAALTPLLSLMLCFYLTCGFFIFVVLGLIAQVVGFKITLFLKYLRDELLTVLGTSSSESGLAPLMEKLEKLGCSRSVVGIVVPAGYSFNLDGTNIYLTLCLLFIAQAMNIDLSFAQQASILGLAMLTSKGASGVAGAGFITLAATLTVVPDVPVAGLALILGVDRFMSEARALTNFIGNGVASLVISKWEGELNLKQLQTELLSVD